MINAGTGELPEGTVRPVTEAFVAAARLPQTDPDQAARIGLAEGQATLALLRALGDGDWTRPTDCTEWDVRTLVSHLVAQCEDSIRLGTLLRPHQPASAAGGCPARAAGGRSQSETLVGSMVWSTTASSSAETVSRSICSWSRALKASIVLVAL